ncbi:MAG: PduL/EutD family phosphate acyltransferase [Bacillota bacterium]|nr:PduL/EutD family phosphate acyltransferase [Bacillota bacterium]
MVNNEIKIRVGVSARHIHLQEGDVEILFGPDYQLTPNIPLIEINSYVVQERVKLVGPKGEFPKVAIIIPHRPKRQIELSKSDAFALGIKPPINESGDHTNAAELLVVGPKGSLTCTGVIIPQRHIHLCGKDAKALNVQAGDYVEVTFKGTRETIFPKVKAKEINEQLDVSELHIDTDEANAVDVTNGDMCIVRKVD